VNRILTSKWTKVIVFCLCLVPFGWLLWRILQNDLTANPSQFLEHRTGDWTIRFIVFTLAISPLRKILHMPALIRFRRMIGLYAFFYVCLHFTAWIWFDKFFAWPDMWADVHKRPFITLGFTGFVLLIPLAITSTAGWIRRMGGKNWQMLHRLIYLTATLGAIHYYWSQKSDKHKPLEYAAVIAALLLWRLGIWIVDSRKRAAAGAPKRPQAAPTTAESA